MNSALVCERSILNFKSGRMKMRSQSGQNEKPKWPKREAKVAKTRSQSGRKEALQLGTVSYKSYRYLRCVSRKSDDDEPEPEFQLL